MGKSNEFASPSAKKIFVGFPKDNYPKKYQDKMDFSGQILRLEIKNIDKNIYDFNLNKTKPTIFITGGSQGARNINNVIFGSLSELLSKYNLIHHVGALDYKRAIEIRSSLSSLQKRSYYISELLTDSKDEKSLFLNAIFQSEIVATRASATTLGEIAALSKTIIAIPYKHAASDHQTKNSEFLKKNKAAIVINDDKHLRESLLKQIDHLFEDPADMKQLANNAYDIFPRDGLTKIVKEIMASL
jgi:UDP-N-acetylglucosamine--N-acetylmuramyl-(pentapeptide) pyrophosphoryl-undecaprenol N-acetylglucosamine transferase